jgi:UDPglucose--hexose-1-phosphate uridylyltransferase
VGELRKDYILDQWVIIEERRGKRPMEFKTAAAPSVAGIDFFAPGNENQTPPEIGRIPDGKGGWRMRWFENKFAALHPEGTPEPRTDNAFFTWANNYGRHEVIVETPDNRQLWDLSNDELTMLLGVIRDRTNALAKEPHIRYVNVFKNSGPLGGTSLVHSHLQVIADVVVPPRVMKECSAVRKFLDDPYERIIAVERTGPRLVKVNEGAIAFCPYASRFNFEAWVFPTRFARDLNEVGDLRPMADCLHTVLVKLKELNCSFNIVFHYSPAGEDLRFHLEILPRIANWAGFEFGTEIVINVVSPETAAAFYRGEA